MGSSFASAIAAVGCALLLIVSSAAPGGFAFKYGPTENATKPPYTTLQVRVRLVSAPMAGTRGGCARC